MTSIPFALWPLDSLAFWEEEENEVVIAKTGGAVGGGMGHLVEFQILSGNPSQASLLKQSGLGVDCKDSKDQAHKWPEHWSCQTLLYPSSNGSSPGLDCFSNYEMTPL